MYRSNILNMVVKCVEESEWKFRSEWDHITTLQTLLMIIDKYSLDNFMDEYHFSKDEYNKYLKSYTKEYNISLHKKIKQSFKNMEKDNES